MTANSHALQYLEIRMEWTSMSTWSCGPGLLSLLILFFTAGDTIRYHFLSPLEHFSMTRLAMEWTQEKAPEPSQDPF